MAQPYKSYEWLIRANELALERAHHFQSELTSDIHVSYVFLMSEWQCVSLFRKLAFSICINSRSYDIRWDVHGSYVVFMCVDVGVCDTFAER